MITQRPGTRIAFRGINAPRITPNAASIVAIPLVSDWGPVGTDPPGLTGLSGGPQLLSQFSQYTDLYGDSDTAGRTAVAGAFAGDSLPNGGGAGGVFAVRMCTASGAQATATINATGAGAPTLTLKGIYKGTRGNRISFAIDANPSDATQDRIRIYFDGVLQETYLYKNPGLAAAVAVINARSHFVTATALVLDTAPALRLTQNANPIALAAGNDGSTVLSADHLAALAQLQFKSFAVLAPYDLTDTTIKTAYQSWAQGMAAASKPVRVVFGGLPAESVATATAEAITYADEHIVRVGVGTYHDDLLDKDLSTSQLAPRIAGIIAAKGDSHSITFADIGGVHMVVGPSDDSVLFCVQSGVVVLTPSMTGDADTHVEMGVTTFTGDTVTKPYSVYSDVRLIGLMDDYVRQMTAWGNKTVVGKLPVNDDTRSLVYGKAREFEDALLTGGLILPGDDINIPRPYVIVPVTTDDTLPYQFGWQFARTANQILGAGSIL